MPLSSLFLNQKYKVFKTLAVYLSYCCIGSGVTLIGSSLLDLQIRVNVDFATISYLIPARSIGHIVGSALVGVLDRYFKHPIILFVTGLTSGIFIAIAPNLTDFKLVVAFLFTAGIFHGIGDVTSNTLVTVIWKEKSANWLQVLHMFWGVGSLVTPIICRPFLLAEIENVDESLTRMSNATDIVKVPDYTPEDVLVQYAFAIIATFTVIFAIPFGFIYLKERREQAALDKSGNEGKDIEVVQSYSPLKVYTAVAIVAAISHIIFSIETLLGSLGPSIAVKSDLHMEKKNGVLLSTVFWTTFSFYRVIFISLTFIVSTTKLLSLSLALSFTGFAILVPWANYDETCMWAGFALIGIGTSPIFSAAYGMLAKNIIITSRISSMVFIPGVLGESMHPALAAILLDKSPVACLYYVGVSGILFITFYIILLVYCAKVFKKVPMDLHPHQPVSAKTSIRSLSRY